MSLRAVKEAIAYVGGNSVFQEEPTLIVRAVGDLG